MTSARVRIWTCAAFVLALCVGAFFTVQIERARNERSRRAALSSAANYGERLKERLNLSISATYALSAVLHQGNGKIDNFEAYALEMERLYGGITNIQLAPNGVVKAIVPLKGNEKAIGHDLFADEARRKEAILTRESKKLTLAGPIKLRQGGVAVIARLAVFLPSSKAPDKFWGFTAVLIRIDDLIQSSDLGRVADEGYDYQLWRTDPYTDEKSTIASSTSKTLSNPVSYAFSVPNALWTLSLTPKGGWYATNIIFAEVAIDVLFASLVAILIFVVLQQPLRLSKDVETRTAELSEAMVWLRSEIESKEQAQVALAKSELEFRAIFEFAPVGIANVNRDGMFVRANPALVEMLGYTEDELKSLHFQDVTFPADLETCVPLLQQLIDSKEASINLSKRYIRKDGRIVNTQVSASGIRDQHGNYVNTVAMIRDVTDQLALENQLRQSQKLQAIGTLAGGIAHDFNNILAAIRGNVNLMKGDLPGDHVALESLREIDKASFRASELVKQILTFGRQHDNTRENVELEAQVTEALKLLRATIPSTITFKTNFQPGPFMVESNATEIHQLLMNLGTNAEYAMRGGQGTLTIGLKQISFPEDASTPLGLGAGKYVELSVQDTGNGMDPSIIERAFEPFFTTKAVGQGTGLGLSVVHGIMTSLGGTVTIESERGTGSKINLLFPLVKGSVQQSNGNNTMDKQGQGETILFVDDEESLVFLSERLLGRLGYNFVGYTDPQEALSRFQQEPTRFDVVMCDISMPGMNGIHLVKKLRAIRPEIPVILMTGYIREDDAEQAQQVGAMELVLKPNTVEGIGDILNRVLRNHSHV